MGGEIGKFSFGIVIALFAVIYIVCVAVITIHDKIKKWREEKSQRDES